MLKGAQKRMVVIKTNDSEMFEEAYFVLKAGCESERLDMVAEAERIIDSSVSHCEHTKKKDKRKSIIIGACALFLGMVLGSILPTALRFLF